MSGALILAALCAMLGISAAYRLRSRMLTLRAWQRALLSMRAACAYARSSAGQILRAGAAEAGCLLPIARRVETEGADAEALFAALPRDHRLKNEEHQVLLNVLRAVAHGSRPEIAQALDYALERFGDFCARCDQKRREDEKLYLTLGILAGVCVFLILC